MPIVKRGRLAQHLSSTRRVTLIAAGAGLGKSVAIRERCERASGPALHYEVRADSFVPFVRGFVECASQAAPGLRASFAGAIELATQSSKPYEEAALWICGHLSGAKIDTIAIEDLHRSSGDERIARFLVRLIAAAPPEIRWILAARDRAALPERELADAGVDVAALSEDDLRLTEAEAAAIAEPAGLSPGAVRRLLDLTHGEPAAFHFGVYAFDERDAPDGDVYRFYAGRYFDRCPENLRELLLGICIFEQVDEQLLRRSPWASSAHYVPALSENGLIFSARDRGRFRLHEPFRTMLLERLGSPAAEYEAKRRGARLLEERGSIGRALELYLDAGDPENVVRLCERHGFDLADRGHLDVLRRSLAHLGQERIHESAVLLALKALSESYSGRTDTAESWYLHALRLAVDTQLHASIAYRYAIDLIRQGRTESVTLLEPFAEQPQLGADLAAKIHATLATAYVVSSRFDEARTAMDRALRFTASSDSLSLHASTAHQAAWVSLFVGLVPQAKQQARRAVELALSCDSYDVAARAYSVLYNISYDLEDDAREGQKFLNAVWECGTKAGDVRMRLFALIGSFEIAADLGDTEELARMERTLEAYDVDYADSMISEALLPAQALRLAASGDFAEAFRLLQPTGERQGSEDRRALRFAEIALYAAGAGLFSEARAAIAHALERMERLDPSLRRTQRTNAVLAVALYLVGKNTDARARLSAVLSAQEHASQRIRMLTQTLDVLFARWDGAENFEPLLDALQSLRESDFGGIAAVLAALPYALPRNAA